MVVVVVVNVVEPREMVVVCHSIFKVVVMVVGC